MTAIVLAGGRGRRMGGLDKGLVVFQDKPLVAHVLDRLAGQVADTLIIANRNQHEYARWGKAVFSDEQPGYQGPLAGIAAGLREVSTPYALLAPCDAPFYPADLLERLAPAMADHQLIFPNDGQHDQILLSLVRSEVLANLDAFLEQGGRRVMSWVAGLDTASVDMSEQASAFVNFNDRDALLENT